jgi:hypothetical protein
MYSESHENTVRKKEADMQKAVASREKLEKQITKHVEEAQNKNAEIKAMQTKLDKVEERFLDLEFLEKRVYDLTNPKMTQPGLAKPTLSEKPWDD